MECSTLDILRDAITQQVQDCTDEDLLDLLHKLLLESSMATHQSSTYSSRSPG